jgi:universal stress protein A
LFRIFEKPVERFVPRCFTKRFSPCWHAGCVAVQWDEIKDTSAKLGVVQMFTIKKILVPSDLRKKSLAGIKYAISLAREYGAEVVVLHVVSESAIPLFNVMTPQEESLIGRNYFAAEQGKRYFAASEIEAGQRRLRAFLDQNIEPEIRHAVNIAQSVRLGDPAEEILVAACREDCDLIVMASRGKGWLSRAVTGSLSESVARHAPCPVVTIQPSAVVHEDERWVAARSMALYGI